MKNKISAVIGASYGDEGKGTFVNYLTSVEKIRETAVVRYNGGAQCGHTSYSPTGVKHIFSHFGSGVFNNCPTILTNFVVVHPMLFRKEFDELQSKGYTPITYVSPSCIVTTPFDQLYNRLIEMRRGVDRHGSVGVGFNETITRHEGNLEADKLRVYDLKYNTLNIRKILINIRDLYFKPKLGPQLAPEEQLYYDLFDNDNVIDAFIEDCKFFVGNTNPYDYEKYSIFDKYDIVFEGGQGLLLDQNYGQFPYVTRSNTGVRNILELLPKFKNHDSLQLYYLHRMYTTKHGNGPLAYEKPMPSWVVDETNKPNDWQGTLRYAPLNIDSIQSLILKEREYLQRYMKDTPFISDIDISLVCTCVDQPPDADFEFIFSGESYTTSKRDFVDQALAVYSHLGYGPTTNDIIKQRRK